ncbi:magnesium-dependent phosphatase-1 [Mycena amicta]|nr:magnesium-dependent phosphatase-1 [Mycena amicta]
MSADSESRLPKLVAFDLDHTLWDLWIDTATGPLRRTKTNTVVDRHGTEVAFYGDVGGIIRRLRREGVFVAACSRTHAIDLAREALSLIRIPPGNDDESSIEEQPAIELFDNLQIYPGSKIAHFRALQDKTGIPYEEMLFFDDESRNREVERLGVTFYLTPDGVSNGVFEAGVKTWNVRRG